MKYRIVDLFAGLGGFRQGMVLAGKRVDAEVDCAMSAENDVYARQTYQNLYNDDPFNDVASDGFKRKLESVHFDILCAGFPCQPFSRSGKQEGFLNTTRGTLFFDLAQILQKNVPPAFLFENVDNLVSHDKGRTFSTIIHTLEEELSYHVVGVEKDRYGKPVGFPRKSFLVNSRHFGVPQNRPRVYLMGFSREHFSSHKLKSYIPTMLPQAREKPPLYNDLSDILDTNVPPQYFIAENALASMRQHKARHIGKGNGFGYVVVNNNGSGGVANALLATGGSGKERNVVYDSSGLRQGGVVVGRKKSPINREGLRFMTPQEWGKLQGFINYAFLDEKGDDLFSFPTHISDTQRYKMFGNAVTVPVVEELGTVLLETLKKLESSVPFGL